MQNASTMRDYHGALAADEADALLHAGENRFRGLLRIEARLEHEEGNDGRKKGEAVESEAPFFAQLGECDAAQRRTDDARHVELNGLQGDGVRHVFFTDQRGNQRLVGGSAECLGETGNEREAENLPDADEMEGDEGGEQEGGAHLHALRDEQHLAALDAVGHHAADQGEQKDRDAAEEGIEAEQEGRVGELQNEPALGGNLHPGADAGGAGAYPHQAEVAILKSFEDPANHDWVLFGKANMPEGMNWIVAVPRGAEL